MGEERHGYSWLTYQQCCAWLVFGNRMSEGQVSSSIDIFYRIVWMALVCYFLFICSNFYKNTEHSTKKFLSVECA